jgi:Ni,Fe-hydrogenase III large subunit
MCGELSPPSITRNLDIPENAETTGDVYARAKVRADEVMQSIAMIQGLLKEPSGNRLHGSADEMACRRSVCGHPQ